MFVGSKLGSCDITSANLQQLIINCVTQLFQKRKKFGFCNCKYLQWTNLHVDKHTITAKTYLNNTFLGKKIFGLFKRFVITRL